MVFGRERTLLALCTLSEPKTPVPTYRLGTLFLELMFTVRKDFLWHWSQQWVEIFHFNKQNIVAKRKYLYIYEKLRDICEIGPNFKLFF
jgi:hypothetical protein